MEVILLRGNKQAKVQEYGIIVAGTRIQNLVYLELFIGGGVGLDFKFGFHFTPSTS